MRLVFMGTPAFAVAAVAALHQSQEIAAVYTQPPKPAGRGQKEKPSAVHMWALEHHIPVYTPKTLKTLEAQQEFAALQADIAVVAAYGLILPPPSVTAPRWGCLNIHASLLPRWRGAAPIHRAIEAGDTQTGITIMQMDAGLDTGDMLLTKTVPLANTMTTATLHDILAALGADAICEALQNLRFLTPTSQPSQGVTYAAKITKAEAAIDWHEEACVIERKIRAFYPHPAAWFSHNGETFKVLAATVEAGHGQNASGTLLDEGLLVACGANTALRITKIQRQGKSALSAGDFLRGYPLKKGDSLAL
jgi:methionyl-tRNA formyltransferase